jgi:hypothetical protein
MKNSIKFHTYLIPVFPRMDCVEPPKNRDHPPGRGNYGPARHIGLTAD